MRSVPKILSKSRILLGYRCLKSIYLKIHHPDKETPISEDLQTKFDQGHEVNREARKLFPNGSLVNCKPWEFLQSAEQTQRLIDQGVETIYEASFCYQGCYCRMDIIHYSKTSQSWSLYEVKSSTRVKDVHIDDLSLQSWIISKSGLKIEKIHVVHIDSKCANSDTDSLFKIVDVTDRIRECFKSIPEKLSPIAKVIQEKEIPDVPIGEHCVRPDECQFKNYCWKPAQIPELSILNISPLDEKWEFLNRGIVDITDDRITGLNKNQQRQIACHKKGTIYKNVKSIQQALSSWTYPLIFLDFETTQSAIPKIPQSSPYEQIPFQFSVHILRSPDSLLEHHEFLDEKGEDPRLELIEKLLPICEDQGSLVAYYKNFEIQILKKLAEVYDQYKEKIFHLIDRMEDPLPILRQHYYDPKFQLSYSLKRVTPAILGEDESYELMEIGEGMAAQRSYKKLISPDTSKEEKATIKKNLLKYCKKDTENLARIVQFLFKLS